MRLLGVARGVALFVIWAAVLALTPRAVEAQYFGRNKVEYRDFDYRILRTAHFDIYYDRQDERSVHYAARMAERWYTRLSDVLDHEFSTRQPLMLYGSHPAFGQNNIVSGLLDETIGGVTESTKRRIVMPFAASLADTDHVLGHEIVHAFQFDMAKRHRISRAFPLWLAEGMAEYLSVGPRDPLTAAWLRDAVKRDSLPEFEKLARLRIAPYRFGHAAWAWLVSEFGEGTMREMLKRPPSGKVLERLASVTGRTIAELSSDWAEDARAMVGNDSLDTSPARTMVTSRSGRLHIAPALSPDGERIAFVSERDGVSADLYVANVSGDPRLRKLLASTRDPDLESMQLVHSAGAWRPDGNQLAYAAVRTGAAVILLLDPETGHRDREIRFPQFGEVLSPTWSPDGSALAFAALDGGVTDLYVYELAGGSLTRLTQDAFADVQPAWSPGGRSLIFATDRFTSNLDRLQFGPLQLASLDLHSRVLQPLATVPDVGQGFSPAEAVGQGFSPASPVKSINPQWAPDGKAVYFLSDPGGITDVYRLELASGAVTPVSASPTSVTGLTSASPALTVATRSGHIAFSVLHKGRFEIRGIDPPSVGQGFSPAAAVGQGFSPAAASSDAGSSEPEEGRRDFAQLAPASSGGAVVTSMLADAARGLPVPESSAPLAYKPRLGLDGIAQPFLASGSNRFGSYLRAGASVLFNDFLGEQLLGIGWQAGTRIYDLAIDVRYINRERRWNWGVAAELTPLVRSRSIGEMVEHDGRRALTQDIELRQQTSTRFGGSLAYPFSRARRVEFGAGVRHLEFDRERRLQTRFMPSGKLVSDLREDLPAAGDVVLGEAAVAYVHDTARWGAASPRLGSRWRLEAIQTLGELSYSTLSADYRRYFLPLRGVTIAARIAPSVRIGGDADDPRLFPMYAGARVPVRGYYGRSLTASCAARADQGCIAGDDLFGHRMVATNLEIRVPFNLLPSTATLPLWAEAIAFTDTAYLWAADPAGADRLSQHRIRSVGAGVRLSALGMLFEVDAVKPLDRLRNGWTLGVFARPGF